MIARKRIMGIADSEQDETREMRRLTLGQIQLVIALVVAIFGIFLGIVALVGDEKSRNCLHGLSGPFGAIPQRAIACEE